tara:strand:+ start:533 stop:1495 length:963 start_codon:yes stop_codon:yes gene_type:complete
MKIATIGEIHEEGLKLIPKNKFDIIKITDTSPKALIKNLSDVEAIAIRTSNLSSDILSECKNLKIVSRHGVGYDNVDINYLNKKNIPLAITATSNAVSVAEHVLMMMLSLSRKLIKCNSLVKNNLFTEGESISSTYELYKKNILILGFGRIGKVLQKICHGFDMNIYVYDPFISEKDINSYNCKKIEFMEGIEIADYISIHMPLNHSTKNLITKKELEKMKNTCFIINTARGGILNQKDLIWALDNKVIGGAGLDVFTDEPPKKADPILISSNNLILTPHNSALTLECRIRMGIETIKNIISFIEGKPIYSNIINREILT